VNAILKKQPSIETIAREQFDYENLRPGQREAIESVVKGRDTLVVMPTGAGKSAVYQIAAQMLRGPAVIVSPLIALQKNQVESLEEQDVGGAAVINSSISEGRQKKLLEELKEGELEYMFLTPEQLNRSDVRERVRQAKPALFVIDEAHCISEWGHDFRPDYLNLGRVIEELGHPVTLALTATASEQVRNEITSRLCMRDPIVFVKGFDRPNIRLGVHTAPNEPAKRELLLARVEEAEKPGIVYVSSRKHAEEIAASLVKRGVNALAYHGGMTPKQRSPIQDDFMEDRIDVIVATSAFGMGVDKPNVRFVFYYDVPHSIDAFYQGIGRAGRDGEPAESLLLYRPEDLGIHKFFAGSANGGASRLEKVATVVLEQAEPVAIEELQEKTELSRSRLTQTLNPVGRVRCGGGSGFGRSAGTGKSGGSRTNHRRGNCARCGTA
jgi:ATP-dependent DNA helicase RecQ